jgi:hypothetical protein
MFSEKKKIFETFFCSEVSVFTALTVYICSCVKKKLAMKRAQYRVDLEINSIVKSELFFKTVLVCEQERWLNGRAPDCNPAVLGLNSGHEEPMTNFVQSLGGFTHT